MTYMNLLGKYAIVIEKTSFEGRPMPKIVVYFVHPDHSEFIGYLNSYTKHFMEKGLSLEEDEIFHDREFRKSLVLFLRDESRDLNELKTLPDRDYFEEPIKNKQILH